jgi:hypothetical protein
MQKFISAAVLAGILAALTGHVLAHEGSHKCKPSEMWDSETHQCKSKR